MLELLLDNKKNELLNICIIYRLISITVSTIVYLIMVSSNITYGRLGIAAGMIASCFVGIHLYKKSILDGHTYGFVATMILETIFYAVLIFLSGGFSSPYLWYFISSMTIVMTVDRIIYKVFTFVSVAGCLISALMSRLYLNYKVNSNITDINIALGFVMVAVGFYILMIYARKLNEKKEALTELNLSIETASEQTKQALNNAMELYGTLNLFAITNPEKIMQELVDLLCRVIAPSGCMLIRVSTVKEIMGISSAGFSEQCKSLLLKKISELEIVNKSVDYCEIDILGNPYSIIFIKNSSQTIGIFVRERNDLAGNTLTQNDEAQQQFYINLIRVMLKELDYQEMVGEYIISDEQNRIASEIHDTVIQKLFAIACDLHLLIGQQETISSQENRERLKSINHAVEATMKELREAIYGLQLDVDENALTNKLKLYINEIERLSQGVEINLTMDDDAQAMTLNQKTALYRTVCESVNNAIRHGKATKINARIAVEGSDIIAEITDNGRGFAYPPVSRSGQGLKNMNHLANLLSGHFSVDSHMGMGTAVKFSLPK